MQYSLGDILRVKVGNRTISVVVVDTLSINDKQAGVMAIEESRLERTDWIIEGAPRPYPFSRILRLEGHVDPTIADFLAKIQEARRFDVTQEVFHHSKKATSVVERALLVDINKSKKRYEDAHDFFMRKFAEMDDACDSDEKFFYALACQLVGLRLCDWDKEEDE